MSRTAISPVASARPRRTPLSARNRLSVRNQEPGYFYRIVNSNLENDPDRVERLIEQGYEIVPQDKTGSVGDKRVDNPSALGSSSSISVGQGTKAVVMRIREEYFKEDQATKLAQIDSTEQTMKRAGDYGTVEITK